MGFSFNPLFWFLCGSCKEAFPSTDELKEHKLKQHLQDCLRIKIIVFEEKFVDDTWTPLNRHSSTPASNSSLPNEKIGLHERNQEQRFQNPYVALNRPSPTSNYVAAQESRTETAKRSLNLPDESPPSKSKRNEPSESIDKKTYENESSKIRTPIHVPILIPKEELEECEETEPPSKKASCVSPFSNEIPHSDYNSKEVRNRNLMNASMKSTSGGTKPDFSPHLVPSPFQTPQSNFTEDQFQIANDFIATENDDTDPFFPTSSVNPPINSFSCSYEQCQTSFRSKRELSNHMKEHVSSPHVDLNLDLPLAQWLLQQEEANPTNQIFLQPHPNSSKNFPPVSKTHPVACKLCEKPFQSEPDLRLHVTNCFLFNKERHRYCQVCNRSFSSPHAFRKHNSSIHSTDS